MQKSPVSGLFLTNSSTEPSREHYLCSTTLSFLPRLQEVRTIDKTRNQFITRASLGLSETQASLLSVVLPWERMDGPMQHTYPCVHGGGRCKTPETALAGLARGSDVPPRRTEGSLGTSSDYRTGEKAAGISSLLSCRIGRTPVWGGHAPPAVREASRTRVRSVRSLYTQVWTNLFSPPSSLVQQAARGENCSRASMALLHPSSTFGRSPGA